MKNLKKNNGITLVALVVTIVVMLILAGVSINIMVGDNGMLTKAQGIKENIEKAEAEGQERINSLQKENYIKDGVTIINDENAPTINSMEVTDITDSSFTVKVTVTETGSGLAKIEYSIDDGTTYLTPNYNKARAYTFEKLKVGFEEYKVKVRVTDVNNNSSYASKTIEKFQIGDYVNYTYDTVASGYSLPSTQSGCSDQTISQNSTALQWRILNIDETTRTIDLVSETPTDIDVYFQGALGYNNGVYLLNDICAKLYSNNSKGITARSINLEDTEKHLTTAGLNARNSYNIGTATYGSTKTYTSNYWYPNLYAYEIGSGVNVAEANASSISQPDKTMANLDPYKESKASPSTSFIVPTTATTEANSKTQARNNVLTITQTYYGGGDILPFNTTNYGEAGAVLTASNYYWVASRYAHCDSSDAFFGLRRANVRMNGYYLFNSNGHTDGPGFRLRPVVSLSSSILSDTKDADGHWNLR